MSTKTQKTQFKQIRTIVKNDENVALEKAMKSLSCNASDLETAHNEKSFVFRLKNAPASTENEIVAKLFTIEKDANYTLQNAKNEAMQFFETFEGNIKIADEDETHIVFSKVRE